ncbi:MAG TPA: phosphoribulokinase [Methylophilaceae bacterium]|nr:phosphoribulokinase [Methylophilaceae bacterium]
MSKKHPVIAVTGSSGAGTSTVKRAFEHIFRRENIAPVVIEGDSFHAYNRQEFREEVKKAEADGNSSFSHFGPEANHFDKLEALFRTYGKEGSGQRRFYLHNCIEAAEKSKLMGAKFKTGEFTPWEDIPANTDLLFYEGLHGLVKTDQVSLPQHVDLGIGVVPVVNLEWIQKIHRDNAERGYPAEATVDTIVRRMRDYVNYITPQFSHTHINFQRVATVDTSNPFISRDIPTLDESFVIIRFRDPGMADFPYLLTMIQGAFMSRPNTIVVPGGKMGLAMEIILTPLIRNLMDKRGAFTHAYSFLAKNVEHALQN